MRYLLALALIICITGCGGTGPRTGSGGKTTYLSGTSASVTSVDVYDAQGNLVPKTSRLHIVGPEPEKDPRHDFHVHVVNEGKLNRDWLVHFSDPEFELYSGWAYFIGRCPIAYTKRVRAIGNGTRMVVQIEEDGSMHRVFYLHHEVTPKPTIDIFAGGVFKHTLKTPRTFIEVDAYGAISGILDLDKPAVGGGYEYEELRLFIQMVEAETVDLGG